MHHHGQLWLLGAKNEPIELFNHARTAAYLANSAVLGCGRVSNILDAGGCDAYTYLPTCTTPPARTWTPTTFTNPVSDQAPWYNSGFSASSQFLGFWIDEWTGLDDSHLSRTVQPIGLRGGGGILGPVAATERVMAFNVLLFGESESALEYGFRWLAGVLSAACSTCSLDTIMFRRICPSIANIEDGLTFAHKVGMVSGLAWEEPPIESQGCFMRKASFTLAAGDPCLYGPDSQIVTNATSINIANCLNSQASTFGSANFPKASRKPCQPVCSDLHQNCSASWSITPNFVTAGALRVMLSNPSGTATVPEMRVSVLANISGMGIAGRCTLPVLGEVNLRPIPPNGTIIYDVGRRKLLYGDPAAASPVNAAPFLLPNPAGVPRWFALGCSPILVVVSLNSLCYDVGTSPYATWKGPDGTSFSVQMPVVSIETAERMGCS
jgi:hypothetical protein